MKKLPLIFLLFLSMRSSYLHAMQEAPPLPAEERESHVALSTLQIAGGLALFLMSSVSESPFETIVGINGATQLGSGWLRIGTCFLSLILTGRGIISYTLQNPPSFTRAHVRE